MVDWKSKVVEALEGLNKKYKAIFKGKYFYSTIEHSKTGGKRKYQVVLKMNPSDEIYSLVTSEYATWKEIYDSLMWHNPIIEIAKIENGWEPIIIKEV